MAVSRFRGGILWKMRSKRQITSTGLDPDSLPAATVPWAAPARPRLQLSVAAASRDQLQLVKAGRRDAGRARDEAWRRSVCQEEPASAWWFWYHPPCQTPLLEESSHFRLRSPEVFASPDMKPDSVTIARGWSQRSGVGRVPGSTIILLRESSDPGDGRLSDRGQLSLRWRTNLSVVGYTNHHGDPAARLSSPACVAHFRKNPGRQSARLCGDDERKLFTSLLCRSEQHVIFTEASLQKIVAAAVSPRGLKETPPAVHLAFEEKSNLNIYETKNCKPQERLAEHARSSPGYNLLHICRDSHVHTGELGPPHPSFPDMLCIKSRDLLVTAALLVLFISTRPSLVHALS
ncbi:unnamed protein product [Pleuronectes platessa]|uniref:Uncharacterized protein n=1 Tax=Pleuronectes platessa TaxID=8262 RepID=A0A9N7VHB3_PLEPL|nr:unnamed protein product [Pleuronectes platessa]